MVVSNSHGDFIHPEILEKHWEILYFYFLTGATRVQLILLVHDKRLVDRCSLGC